METWSALIPAAISPCDELMISSIRTVIQKVELPGQYTGFQCPDPDSHIHIVNFSPRVRVMKSIRRPKQMTFHGSDEREYDFLVKGNFHEMPMEKTIFDN